MGPLRKERHKAGGHSEGHSCKTSDHLPSTRLPAQSDMTCIISLSARIHWWLYPNWNLSLLSRSELISFLFNLAPLICHLFVKAVLNLCQRSMELRLYITAGSSVFCRESTLSLPKPLPPCQLTRSLSTEVTATTNANENPALPPQSSAISHQRMGTGIFFFTSLSTPCQIHRLMIPTLILLAGVQPKKIHQYSRSGGWVSTQDTHPGSTCDSTSW